jgi:hypothetical protein
MACCKPSIIRVTPHDASRAVRALRYAQRADNLRIEIAAARIVDAFCQGRLLAVDDVADVDDFLFAAESAGSR